MRTSVIVGSGLAATAALILGLFAVPEGQAEVWPGKPFSATIVTVDPYNPNKEQLSKFYIDTPGIRGEQMDDGMPTIGILRFADNKMFMISPRDKTYVEFAFGEAKPEDLIGLSVLGSVEPCVEYKKSNKLGAVTLNRRPVEKWRCELAKDNSGLPAVTLWFDRRIGFVVRELGDDGSLMEMRNIKEGRQPARLFEPPAGYTKVDMTGMMGLVMGQPGPGQTFAQPPQGGMSEQEMEKRMQESLQKMQDASKEMGEAMQELMRQQMQQMQQMQQ